MIEVRKVPGGHVLPVLVSAGAARNRLLGEHDGRVKVSLTAPPEKGKANRALCDLIAGKLGVSRSQVKILSGRTSRHKEVLVEHVSPIVLDGIIG